MSLRAAALIALIGVALSFHIGLVLTARVYLQASPFDDTPLAALANLLPGLVSSFLVHVPLMIFFALFADRNREPQRRTGA